MAEFVLSSVAERIIKLLTTDSVQEIGLLWGVNDELSGLEDTILTIKAVLIDAEKKQVHSNQVRVWLGRLEDVVYEADDLMDEISTEALRRELMTGSEIAKEVCTFFSTSNQFAFRLKMKRKIEAIKKRLALIRDDRHFHLEESNEDTMYVNTSREQTHSFVSQEEVIIGREDDRMKIVETLLDMKTDENLLVVPIVGSGGFGKTTLAQLVFNDERVQKHFDLKMWVCVSNMDFDVELLVEKILQWSKTNKERSENYGGMEILQKELRQKISGKKYLLVLDDVWNENRELWLSLRNLLSNDVDGSRIIVTTRSVVVAKIMSKVEPYFLGNLDETQSWSLFKKMAFSQEQDTTNSNVVEIGKNIVKKCGGIPLAIRTIGRMLYFKNPETEWSSFQKIEFSKISQDENDILPTLKLSYDHLPSHLKHCFAYCSLFPKDYEIDVQELIKLWMAQGFIKSTDTTQSLEDVGHDYFMDLHWRSFFQEVEKDLFGNIEKCKMHDLIQDLATQVAGIECAMLPLDRKNINKKTRHVSFGFCVNTSQSIPSSLSQRSNRIRTILLPSQPQRSIEAIANIPICDVIAPCLKFLRTLDMHNSGIKTVSDSIGKLKHLRYLDLSRTKIKVLPNSITKLQNLQTLKLSTLHRFKELPRDIKNLVNLRHLEFDIWTKLNHMPLGLGQLTKLQTLSRFILSEGTGIHRHNGKVGELKELVALNNLRGELEITNLKQAKDATAANLKEKQHLRSLILNWYLPYGNVDVMETFDYEMILEGFQPHPNLKELRLCGYGGVRFSSWLPSLRQLVRFSLWKCTKCQSLPSLDQFPSLKSLSLIDLPAIEYISNESFSSSIAAPLPSLEQLSLKDLPNLKGWWRDGTAGEEDTCFGTKIIPLLADNCMFLQFPCLSSLDIENCPRLKFMPLSTSFKSLTVESIFWKPFHQTMRSITRQKTHETVEETSFSNSSALLSSSISSMIFNLTDLGLSNIDDLQSLPSWLKSLSSLKELSIKKCTKLEYLSPGIQHLVSLQFLYIKECKELDMSNADTITWKALKSLHHLYLVKLPQLQSLPEGLQHVVTLEVLHIEGCNSLIAIPDWISNLSSLKELHVVECPILASLPEGIRSINSLQTLDILDCPILYGRCQREKGEDWPKISHIPELHVWPIDYSQPSTFSGPKWNNFKNLLQVPQMCCK